MDRLPSAAEQISTLAAVKGSPPPPIPVTVAILMGEVR